MQSLAGCAAQHRPPESLQAQARRRRENFKFKVSLGCTVRPQLKTKTNPKPPKYENKSEDKSYLKIQNYFLTSTKKDDKILKVSAIIVSPKICKAIRQKLM